MRLVRISPTKLEFFVMLPRSPRFFFTKAWWFPHGQKNKGAILVWLAPLFPFSGSPRWMGVCTGEDGGRRRRRRRIRSCGLTHTRAQQQQICIFDSRKSSQKERRASSWKNALFYFKKKLKTESHFSIMLCNIVFLSFSKNFYRISKWQGRRAIRKGDLELRNYY